MKELVKRIVAWLLAPINSVKDSVQQRKRRLIFRLLRSRSFFYLVLLFVTSEALGPALGTSWKLFHPPVDVPYWLIVVLAVTQWLYFSMLLIVALPRYIGRLRNRWRRREQVRDGLGS